MTDDHDSVSGWIFLTGTGSLG